MAAGAILPPLFFERRHLVNLFAPRMTFSGTPENTFRFTCAIERPAWAGLSR